MVDTLLFLHTSTNIYSSIVTTTATTTATATTTTTTTKAFLAGPIEPHFQNFNSVYLLMFL